MTVKKRYFVYRENGTKRRKRCRPVRVAYFLRIFDGCLEATSTTAEQQDDNPDTAHVIAFVTSVVAKTKSAFAASATENKQEDDPDTAVHAAEKSTVAAIVASAVCC